MSTDKPFVLLIEDDAASAEALGMILSDWGADVAHAADAGALVAALGSRATAVRYIITDFHLGAGPDGVSLATRVAADAPGSRVLVLSARSTARPALPRCRPDLTSCTSRPAPTPSWPGLSVANGLCRGAPARQDGTWPP